MTFLAPEPLHLLGIQMASTDHLGSGNSVTVSFNGIETVPEQPSQSINDNTSGVTSYGAAIEIDVCEPLISPCLTSLLSGFDF